MMMSPGSRYGSSAAMVWFLAQEDPAQRQQSSGRISAGRVLRSSMICAACSPISARQAAQDAGRHPPSAPWDGRWHTAVATVDQRALADRKSVV